MPLIGVLILAALSITEVPNPRQQNRWVTDMVDAIPADAEARIEARLSALHTETDVEMAVVTVQDVPGTPKSFVTELFNY